MAASTLSCRWEIQQFLLVADLIDGIVFPRSTTRRPKRAQTTLASVLRWRRSSRRGRRRWQSWATWGRWYRLKRRVLEVTTVEAKGLQRIIYAFLYQNNKSTNMQQHKIDSEGRTQHKRIVWFNSSVKRYPWTNWDIGLTFPFLQPTWTWFARSGSPRKSGSAPSGSGRMRTTWGGKKMPWTSLHTRKVVFPYIRVISGYKIDGDTSEWKLLGKMDPRRWKK